MKILIANPVDVTARFLKMNLEKDFPGAVFFLEDTALGTIRTLEREKIDILVTEVSFQGGLEMAMNSIRLGDTLNGLHVLRAAKNMEVFVRVAMCFLCNPRQKIGSGDIIEAAIFSGAGSVICPPYKHSDVGKIIKKLLNGGGKV